MLLTHASQADGRGSSSAHIPLGFALAAGAILGPIVSLTLMATRRWRTGLLGYYASWSVAGVVAGLAIGVVLLLDDPSTPGVAFGFGAFLGFCGGLGLDAFFRQIRDEDVSTHQ